MIWNNIKIALRNLRKNKLFAFINIAGLAIGMTIYVFGGLLISYERDHDKFFENSSRIYTVASTVAPGLDVGIQMVNAAYSAIGPIIEAELPDVEAVARTIGIEYLVSNGTDSFYQGIRFADPEFLEIFDLQFMHGNKNALQDPSAIVLSETAAIKFFGRTDVIGETLTLDNKFDYRVTAVFKDVPRNSHFNSMPVMEINFDVLMPIESLLPMIDFDLAGDYNNLSMGNLTYVMLPESLDEAWLATQLDSIFERLVPDEPKESISAIYPVPLPHANLALWDTFGLPIVTVIQLLSFLVLIVACVNYTNLATAQALGRSREVGMRKTMGAEQGQLLTQFLAESILIASIAMVVAIAVLEIIIPLFNNAANKVMALNYLQTLPWLVATTLLVGVCAGIYPAWLITRASPIDALRDVARKGKKGSRVRAVMIGAQFAISAFMLSLVAVVFMQNKKIEDASYVFPRSEIYTVDRIGVEDIQERLDPLMHELVSLPNVDSVAWSSQVPYEQNNSQTRVSGQPGDEAGEFSIQMLRMSPEFLDVYDIPLLAGRNLDDDMANDLFAADEAETVNILVNEMTLDALGIASPQEAINQRIYDLDEEDALREMVIVGVVPSQNIVGMFNKMKPWMYVYDPTQFRIGSIRIKAGNMLTAVEDIEGAWGRVIPEYPIQGSFLDEVFERVFSVLRFMNQALAGFAIIALMLALIGLFGLAAFMAAQRTKEIGVRKVLGASSSQIARLLVWQFSKPVAWALLISLPLAYAGSNLYLNFFEDRIDSTFLILLASGIVSVFMAWSTVAGHAIKIARSNPVLALRYE